MKWILLTFISVAITFGFVYKNKNANKISIHKESSKSFALLELYTSEGCSSCPSADRLLPQLAILDSNIITLSFHVDYWNHLGWTDPFSHAEFSDRQKEYARQFGLESIYTPQLIINGEFEMVGSNRSTAETDIKNVLAEKPAIDIKVDQVKKENNKFSVSCTLTGNIDQTNVMAALVQKHAETKVKAGENNGAKLSHTNVVRSFEQKSAQPEMIFKVDIPRDVTEDNMQIIVYTQAKKNLRVTGVAVWDSK